MYCGFSCVFDTVFVKDKCDEEPREGFGFLNS